MGSPLSRRKGNYDRSKYRAFVCLEQLNDRFGKCPGWLSTRELVLYAGIPYRSFTGLKLNWVKWEYIVSQPTPKDSWGRGDLQYRLAEHGQSWLDYARKNLHNQKRFHDELKEWVNFVLPYRDKFLYMKFDDFIDYTNKLRQYQGKLKGQEPSFFSKAPLMSQCDIVFGHLVPKK